MKIMSIEATNSHRLYANGLQQVELLVRVQAIYKSGLDAPISAQELQSLELYDARGSDIHIVAQEVLDSYDYKYGPPVDHKGWGWSYNRNTQFVPFPSTGDVPSAVQPSTSKNERRVKIYLHTRTPEVLHVGFRITQETGVVFNSGDVAGGVARLSAIPRKVYQLHDYTFSNDHRRTALNPNGNEVDFTCYTLSLFEHGTHVEFLAEYTSSKQRGMLHLGKGLEEEGAYAGVAFPGSDQFDVLYMERAHIPRVPVSVKKSGTFAIVLGWQKPLKRIGDHRAALQPINVEAVDVYGNAHNIRVDFAAEQQALRLF
jgi:hypothetical protein